MGSKIMTLYSKTAEVGLAAFAKADREMRFFADQAAVLLFVAAGLWLTAAFTFSMTGFGADLGQILAAAG
jgi:type IV secretory pathway TrbD component